MARGKAANDIFPRVCTELLEIGEFDPDDENTEQLFAAMKMMITQDFDGTVTGILIEFLIPEVIIDVFFKLFFKKPKLRLISVCVWGGGIFSSKI